jgi:hypothetical protein
MSLLWIVREHHLLILLALHLVTSLGLIYFKKNKLSYFTEILLLVLTWCSNLTPLKPEFLLCYLSEYLLVKVLLVLIVYFAKRFSFYVMFVITHKQKNKFVYKLIYKKKRFLKIQSHIWNKVQYGIRIKKGIPSMVNKRNSRTGIYFDKDGFPKFKAIAEIKLERKYWKKDRETHFYRASKMLYEQTQKSFRLRNKFSQHAIYTFKQGDIPSKYTWHHHQDKGVLQLVDSDIHSKVRHNGGFSIWGKKE